MMVPKGFPSLTGEREHDSSLSLVLPSACVESTGSVVCNLCSLAIPWETASTEMRDGYSVPPDAIQQ